MSSIPAMGSAPTSSAAGFSLAGALLVVLALPAAGRLATTGLPRWCAIAAVILAALTVVAGLSALVLRLRGKDSGPRLLAVVAGLLLMAATVLTGSAAVAVLAAGPPPAGAEAGQALTVVISGVGEDALLTMRAEMPDVAAGDVVRAEVTATVPDDGGERTVLARQLTVARSDGSVSVALAAPAVGGYGTLQVLVESPDRRCTADLRPQISEAPITSCKPR